MPRPWAAGALVAVAACALYAPTLGHPFLFDDAVQIAENPAVTRGAPLADYFFDRATTSARADYNTRIYRPLRNLGFRAIARVAGVRAIGFELANLALYAGSIALLLALALRLFDGDRTAAAIAAALFAAMPVHVEAVAYPSAFGDQLSCALELAALLAACAALNIGAEKTLAARRAVALGALSVALALGAMLAKEMAVTGGGLLVLVIGWRALRRRRALLLVAAHAAITASYLALRTAVLGRVGQDDVTGATVAAGLRDAPVLLVDYARLCAAPLGHRAAYVVAPPSWAQAALALAGIALAFALASRVRRAALGLGWFALALIPVLHVVPLWADLADRFALVPSAGLALAAAALHRRAADPKIARGRMLANALVAALLVLFAAGTLVEEKNWASDEALWTHAAREEPRSALAQANLGAIALGAGRFEEALAALDRARSLGRESGELELRRALALDALGRAADAETAVARALALDPALGRAHALDGDLLRRRGRLDDAERALGRARALAPDHPSTALLAAALAEARGRPADALAALRDLAARYPSAPRFQFLAGDAALRAGDAADAERAARACLALSPGERQCDGLLGRALVAAGRRTDEARAALDRALAALPDGPDRAACAAARRASAQ